MISSLELARLCGISQGTVDRALHGRAGVSEATRRKILLAAEKHGYRPNPAARELITGTTSMVTFLLPGVQNVFFMDVVAHLAARLEKQGLRLQLSLVPDREEFLERVRDAASRRPRLIIAIPPEDQIAVPGSALGDVPMVTLFSPCRGTNIPLLTIDEEETGRQAVRHLYEAGHRRIMHLTYARKARAINARAEGFRQEAGRLGIPKTVLTDVNAETFTRAMLRHRPTALFCHNDWLALTTMLLVPPLGLRVPEDVSILGVDGAPTLRQMHPELSTLAYPIAKMTDAIIATLEGRPPRLEAAHCAVIAGATVSPSA